MFLENKLYYIYLLSFTLLFPNATIIGKVIDANSKEPLIGVNVILLETTQKVVIDAIGEWKNYKK
mgnify:CR=1 FL=1